MTLSPPLTRGRGALRGARPSPMPDVAKLKKKAAELELKKQFDKALRALELELQGE